MARFCLLLGNHRSTATNCSATGMFQEIWQMLRFFRLTCKHRQLQLYWFC